TSPRARRRGAAAPTIWRPPPTRQPPSAPSEARGCGPAAAGGLRVEAVKPAVPVFDAAVLNAGELLAQRHRETVLDLRHHNATIIRRLDLADRGHHRGRAARERFDDVARGDTLAPLVIGNRALLDVVAAIAG